MRAPALLPPALLTCCGWLLAPVNSVHPECRFHLEIQEEETKCAELLRTQTEKYKACTGVWDNITCWRPADVGETVTVPCPKVFSNFYSKPGNISKNCTSDGWSEMFPDFIDACGYNGAEDESKIAFYILVKAIYTLGYSVSLVSLTTGSIILCLFRKLHCTRNYIHLNLFVSFILRAISVLVKDDVLYSRSGTLHCPDQPSSWGVSGPRSQVSCLRSQHHTGQHPTPGSPPLPSTVHTWCLSLHCCGWLFSDSGTAYCSPEKMHYQVAAWEPTLSRRPQLKTELDPLDSGCVWRWEAPRPGAGALRSACVWVLCRLGGGRPWRPSRHALDPEGCSWKPAAEGEVSGELFPPQNCPPMCRRGRISWEDTHGWCFHSFTTKMESPSTAVSASSFLVRQDIVDSSTPTGVSV